MRYMLCRDMFDEYPKDDDSKCAIPNEYKEIVDGEDNDVEIKCEYDSNTVG
jgi:hypothetical protein